MKVGYEPAGETASVKRLARHLRSREGQLNATRSVSDPGSEPGARLPQATLQRALPHDSDTPSRRAKGVYSHRVPYAVLPQLGIPKLNPCRRQPEKRTALMAVPKTAMDKDNRLPPWQDNVRSTRQLLCMEAKTKSRMPERLPDPQLGLRIPTTDL